MTQVAAAFLAVVARGLFTAPRSIDLVGSLV
jgi:hypothetical protein